MRNRTLGGYAALALICLGGAGCLKHKGGTLFHRKEAGVPIADAPREFDKVTQPEHVIEPPDILRIQALKVVPRGPYNVEALDVLYIQVRGVAQTEPIDGNFSVDLEGNVFLGFNHGVVTLTGLSLEGAAKKIADHLKMRGAPNASATLSVVQSKAIQQVSGEHLVQPDGSVSLGIYGSVRVVGLTASTAKRVVEMRLGERLVNPEVSVEVAAYNSKTFYVIFDGAGRGQQVVRLPITGNDTVLDAIAQLYGITPVSSKDNIWLARPSPLNVGKETIYKIDWDGVSAKAHSATNYQLLPGDRLYVDSRRLSKFDTTMSILLSPLERVFGFTLLGTGTVRAVASPNGGGAGGGF